MKHAGLAVAAMMLASCVTVRDADKPQDAKPELGGAGAPQTLCPVMAGRKINKRLYVDHNGFRIYVCCNPCVKAVRKDPEKYRKELEKQGVVVEKVEHAGATEKNAGRSESMEKRK